MKIRRLPTTDYDKQIKIIVDGIEISFDYDDVDHKQVDALVDMVVAVLTDIPNYGTYEEDYKAKYID